MPILRQYSQQDRGGVEKLFVQLCSDMSTVNLEGLENDLNNHCFVWEDKEKIIGFGSLVIYRTPSKGSVSRLENIIIDSEYRGKGLGKDLIAKLIEVAKEHKIKIIDLTSKKSRFAAHGFYEAFGFQKRESDIFRLTIS